MMSLEWARACKTGSPITFVAAFGMALFGGAANASIGVDPDCPAPADAITITAVGPTVQRDPLSLEVTGSTIKLVAQAYRSGFSLPPGTAVVGHLPALPVGSYRIDFYTRIQPNGQPGGDFSTLLPEHFEESLSFKVYQVPPTCRASDVAVIGNAFATAPASSVYPDALSAIVTDAHGNPIPNFRLPIFRVRPPDEPSTFDPAADVAQPPNSLTTGPDGVAWWAPSANQVPGAFQYQTFGLKSRATFVFYNAPQTSRVPSYPVVEFRRSAAAGRLHFFMSGSQSEMAKLDHSSEWSRTGAVFMAFPPGANPLGASPVCRFYGLPEAGLDSHFFSASPEECDAVTRRFSASWKLETPDAFNVFLPDSATGACPAVTRPLYRAYNNLPDANHRYALTPGLAQQGGTPPWVLEGYGLDAVVMCLPQ